jgi:hypothetical protein
MAPIKEMYLAVQSKFKEDCERLMQCQSQSTAAVSVSTNNIFIITYHYLPPALPILKNSLQYFFSNIRKVEGT